MERRYLAATLALAATFAMFSGEFRTRYLSKVPHTPAQVKADLACARHYVAQQLMAKLESFAGRDAKQSPVLADLNMPELPAVVAVAPELSAGAKCPLQRLQRKAVRPEIRIDISAGDFAKQLGDLNVVRGELLSDRAQEWQARLNERQMEITMKQLQHAQEISARAMDRAQREIGKSRAKTTTPTAIHINFAAPAPPAAPLPPSPASF